MWGCRAMDEKLVCAGGFAYLYENMRNQRADEGRKDRSRNICDFMTVVG